MPVARSSVALSTLLLVSAACGSSSTPAAANTPPATVTWSQSDLTGTWDRLVLLTNDAAGWNHQVVTFDALGALTYVSCRNQLGTFTCSTTPLSFLVDAAGTVSQSGTGGNATFRGTMARDKDLIFGSATAGVEQVFQVFRRRKAGVTYAQADVAFQFTYQVLRTGSDFSWERGTGSVTASGNVNLATILHSAGGTTWPPNPVDTITVAADGTVALAGGNVGFITPDKQSLFFIGGGGPGTVNGLYAVLKTGGSFAQADLAGTWNFHMLTSGPSMATSSWLRGTAVFDASGAATFSNVSSSAGTNSVAGFSVSLGSGGALTRGDLASYGGQMALGKDFYVRTQTNAAATSMLLGARR